MATNLLERLHLESAKTSAPSPIAADARQHQCRVPLESVRITEVTRRDRESRSIARAVTWMMLLAILPLVMFHVINSIFPDLLLISISPN